MDRLISLAEARRDSLTSKIHAIEQKLESMPAGTLLHEKRNERWVYNVKYLGRDAQPERRYLSVREVSLIETLARKKYLIRLLPVLKEEFEVLDRFCRCYHPEKRYEVYNGLSEGVRLITKPEFRSPEDLVIRWVRSGCDDAAGHIESLIFETARGEKVRSKSEVIIADMLFAKGIEYKYEQSLVLDSGYTCHPDFTIMRRSDARLFYWEHFGMLDDPAYAEHCVAKLNMYARAGITPSDGLFITWECRTRPFDRTAANEYIKILLQ